MYNTFIYNEIAYNTLLPLTSVELSPEDVTDPIFLD